MATVLVSGAPTQVALVAQALRRHGAEPVEVPDLDDVPAVVAGAGPGTFGAYIQLGWSVRLQGDTAIQRVRSFYGDGVLARFRALDAVRPTLAPGAGVIFVMGQLPPDVDSDVDRAARRALTEVLAKAVRADAAPDHLLVRILPADIHPEQIAALALGLTPAPRDPDPRVDMSLADWRIELMSATSIEA